MEIRVVGEQAESGGWSGGSRAESTKIGRSGRGGAWGCRIGVKRAGIDIGVEAMR